jgi:predicted nucleic acid-binding protein
MNIFIDTNIFLSFYHLSSDELEELKKLAVLLREKKVILFLPEQVRQEFLRNRANKIADAIKRLRAQQSGLQIPQMGKQYPEFIEIMEAHNLVQKKLSALIESINYDASNNFLEADSVIEELFGVAVVIPRDKEMIDRARQRAELGDPPGKKGSIRDALNWEALLSSVPMGEDLILVTDDDDYHSSLNQEDLDPYMVDEWSKAKKSSIHPYDRPSSMFRDYFPDIKLASELEKDLLIQELAQSGTFDHTRGIISRLRKFTDFTKSQVNAIVSAAITNNQVYWIATYPTIRTFLESIVKGREGLISPENLTRIIYVIEKIKPYGEIPDLHDGKIHDIDEDEPF